MKILAISSEIRDPGIEKHLKRVYTYTEMIMKSYNLSRNNSLTNEYIRYVVNSSVLHDIGKSGVPEGILYKPDRLVFYERRIVEMHPQIGVDILEKISKELDDDLLDGELDVARNGSLDK